MTNKEAVMDNKLNDYYKKLYGEGGQCDITFNGERYIGNMYGNDECFDCNDFYQIVVADGKSYKFYYNADNVKDDDLSNIDYDKPLDVQEENIDEDDL